MTIEIWTCFHCWISIFHLLKLTNTILIVSSTLFSHPPLKHVLRLKLYDWTKNQLSKSWLFYFVCSMWMTFHREITFALAFSGCVLKCIRCSGMFIVRLMQFEIKWHVSALVVKDHTRINYATHILLMQYTQFQKELFLDIF